MARSIILLFFTLSQASAQSGLNQIFNLPDQLATSISRLLIENDTIVTIGSVTDTPGKFGIQFSKYDSSGNVILYHTYYPDDDGQIYIPGQFTGFIRLAKGGYVATTSIDVGDKIAIIRFSRTGEILWKKEIDRNALQVIYCDGVVEAPDGYLIAGWQQDLNYETQAFVGKLSPDGDLLWKKNYGGANDDAVKTIKKRNDNSYFIGGAESKKQSGISEAGFWGRSWLFEIDSTGNLLWNWKSAISEYMMSAKLFEFSGDTAIVYATSRIPHYVSPWLTEFVLRKVALPSGTLLWQKAQNTPDMTYVIGYGDLQASTIDGGWNIVGTYQHYPNGFVQGGLSVHTSAEGDLVWMREDTAWMDPNINVDENYLNCLGQLSSGSIITGGDVLKSAPNWHTEAWLLKISPGGCIASDDCAPLVSATSTPAGDQVFSNWALYPNPTAGPTVLLPDLQATGKEGRLNVYDGAGRLCSRQSFILPANQAIPLDFTGLPSGLYHYQILLDDRRVGLGKFLIVH